jgi:hypothetical protein
MRRTLRALGVAAALTAGAASAARADTLVDQQFCGGNNFSTCAFINASSGLVGGNSVLTLVVTNPAANNAGSVFTDIGIASLPSGAAVTGGTSSSAKFAFEPGGPNGLSGAGIGSDVVGFEANNPQPQNGLKPGQTVTFTFTFDGAYDLSAIQYAFHDQGGAPAGCEGSTKLVVNNVRGDYVANSPSCGPPPPPPPVTSVPEPATMTLLASGILSLGGAGAVKRRGRKRQA